MTDRTRNILYWISTGLAALAFAAGGVFDLTGAEPVLEAMRHLGYPAYVATLLGVWKVLGAVAVLIPGYPRLKEWAYAGMVFDLTGAVASHAAVGDSVGQLLTPAVLLLIVFASWWLRPARSALRVESAGGESLVPAR